MTNITIKQVADVLAETSIEVKAISINGKDRTWFEIELRPQAFFIADIETIQEAFCNARMNFNFTAETLTISVHPGEEE